MIVEYSDTPPPEDTAPTQSAMVELSQPRPSPADAAPISDGPPNRPPTRLEIAAGMAARPASPVMRFFFGSFALLITFLASMAALRFIDNMLNRWPFLGWIAVALFAAFTLAMLLVGLREYAGYRRLAALDGIHRDAVGALTSGELAAAKAVTRQLDKLYAGRPEMEWGRDRLQRLSAEAYDAEDLLKIAEAELIAPLDDAARREVEAASRIVAASTALIPLAFVDIAAAMAANLRMIRRLAEIYGGRAGAVGGWRLTRKVLTHLVATGAVAAGDDLIQTVIGGGALAKLSRRFGEGVVNGALTARVGVAAIEVCRPLPFINQRKPRVTELVKRSLTGLFGSDKEG